MTRGIQKRSEKNQGEESGKLVAGFCQGNFVFCVFVASDNMISVAFFSFCHQGLDGPS